ncbi:MAG: NAD-dependent epimerase/dehydratase family protein, partial [Desulfovibrio sp.]
MKHTLITGATGMVGGQVLQALLGQESVNEVLSLGRRRTGLENPKFREIVHEDFLDYSGLESELASVDVCFHCLATYQSQVTREEYERITCGFPQALAQALYSANPDAVFVLFSAGGADPTGTSRMSFARIKGKAEKIIDDIGFPAKLFFRPGYIHPTSARGRRGFFKKLLAPLGWFLLKLFPGSGVTDAELGRAMVKAGLESPGG